MSLRELGVLCVPLPSYKQASGPLLCDFSLANPGHNLLFLSCAFPFPKNKTGHRTYWSLIAGCTTGSVCPRYPFQKDRVLSFYVGLFCSLLQPSGKYGT